MSRIKDRKGILSTGVEVISYSCTKNKEAYWSCKCPICDNIWEVRGSHLNEPNPISCCKKCSSLKNLEQIKEPYHKDITGQRFGKLVALEKTNKKGSKTYLWKCKCDCGRYCEKELQYLMNGDTQSCGCLTSLQEKNIEDLLTKHKIPFETQKQLFKKYRFDFYINNKYVIEFDGIQHFYQRENRELLENIRKRDLEKNNFCFTNNIPIIRIPYNKNFGIEDLILETSRFILTKENENEYYQY